MSAFEDAVIQRIKQLEREVERLQRWERSTDMGLGKLSDPNADRVLFWDDSAGALKWLTVEGIVDTDLGKWQDYTPTWTAATTNPAIGNGTLAGRYVQLGKTVMGNIYLAPGSTTTFGSGNWAFSLPKTSASSSVVYMGSWIARDIGTNNFSGQILLYNTIEFFARNGAANYNLSSTVPFTWANGDYLFISFTYEIA